MKVNFFATLRDIAGGKTVEFDLNHGATAQELLDAVIERFPRMKKELLDERSTICAISPALKPICDWRINSRIVCFKLPCLEKRIDWYRHSPSSSKTGTCGSV